MGGLAVRHLNVEIAGREFTNASMFRNVFNPATYRTQSDVDDTNALVIAGNLAIAQKGLLLITAPLTISSTITWQPVSGASFALTVLATGTTTQISWTGGSSNTIFHTYGLKSSYLQGLKIQVPDGVNNVVGWDVDVDGTRQSSGTTVWERCSYQAGNGTGNVGWRLGHDPTSLSDSSEESFHSFVGCSVAFSSSGTKTGRIGWVNEHPNGVDHAWTNCSVSSSSRAFTNVSTAGAGIAQGGADMFFDNCGGSNNDVEFEFATTGPYKISGGRWETGTQHLSVPMSGATASLVISESGVEGNAYTSNTSAIFSLLAGVKLSQSGCQFFSSAGDFTSALYTVSAGASGFGSLTLKGNSYRAAAANDQFWTISNGTWSVESTGNTYRDSTGHSTKAFADRLGVWNGTVARVNRNGCYFPTGVNPYFYNVGTVAVANRLYLTRFEADDTFTATKLSFIVTNPAGSNDNVDVGVISGDMATLIGGSGSVAGFLNSNGTKFVTGLSIPLVAGVIYYAYIEMPVAFGTTAPSLLMTQTASGSITGLLGTNIGQATGMNKDGLAFPFPAPPVVTPAVLGGVPVGGLLKV